VKSILKNVKATVPHLYAPQLVLLEIGNCQAVVMLAQVKLLDAVVGQTPGISIGNCFGANGQ
jgi:hypothetical protein